MIVEGIRFVQGRNDYTDVDGRKFAIAIHNTSNNASDEGELAYATWRQDGVSSHFYADDDSVSQSLDTADKAGHAGSTHGNENAISVEITGANGWSRQQWLSNVDWVELGAVLAEVIEAHWPDGSFEVRRASVVEMKANPQVKAFYGHDDMRRAWGGTDHTDPGPNFPWDRLFEVVDEALGAVVAISDEDLKRIARAVWVDYSFNSESLGVPSTKAREWVKMILAAAREDSSLPATVDLDLLAEKVATLLAAKINLSFDLTQ